MTGGRLHIYIQGSAKNLLFHCKVVCFLHQLHEGKPNPLTSIHTLWGLPFIRALNTCSPFMIDAFAAD